MAVHGTPPLSGRRAQAARNDAIILDAAREVFLADPDAPIAAVAERAGVGISALYRRYPSKEELLRKLSLEGLLRYNEEVAAALAAEGDAWDAFGRFMRRALEAGTSALTLRLAGRFVPHADLRREGSRAHELTQRLIDRARAAGALRDDIEVGDLSLIFEQLQAIDVGDRARTAALRQRYLALLLQAMRAPAATPLPGPAPTWAEISGRYEVASRDG